MSLTIVLRETSLSMISLDREQAIEARSGRIADLLLNQLQLRMRTLDTLANFLTAQQNVGEENFRKFSRQEMQQTTGFTAIAVTDLDLQHARWMETSPDAPPAAVLLDLINGEEILTAAVLLLDTGGMKFRPAALREFAVTDPIHRSEFGPGFASLVPFYDDERVTPGGLSSGSSSMNRSRDSCSKGSRPFPFPILFWRTSSSFPGT
ncbi:hypothetical protein IIC65_00175 [Candidatus Sumerlaeota bacterium]|nr:hypothetical protein [Candidatus Sumerlaeota bacterium]